jgi:hypothetical protein
MVQHNTRQPHSYHDIENMAMARTTTQDNDTMTQHDDKTTRQGTQDNKTTTTTTNITMTPDKHVQANAQRFKRWGATKIYTSATVPSRHEVEC